jgi:hypothetical protein
MMNRRTFIAALAALATPWPALAAQQQTVIDVHYNPT